MACSKLVISYKRFKNKHFCGQIDNFMTSIAMFNLVTFDFKTEQV